MGEKPAATREEILARLADHQTDLVRFHLASLAMLGSAARGQLASRSDVDMLVSFAGPATDAERPSR